MLYCSAIKLNGKHKTCAAPATVSKCALKLQFWVSGVWMSHCARQLHGKARFWDLLARIPAKTGGIFADGELSHADEAPLRPIDVYTPACEILFGPAYGEVSLAIRRQKVQYETAVQHQNVRTTLWRGNLHPIHQFACSKFRKRHSCNSSQPYGSCARHRQSSPNFGN